MNRWQRLRRLGLSLMLLFEAGFMAWVVWRLWFDNNGEHLMGLATLSVVVAAIGLLSLTVGVARLWLVIRKP